MIDKLRFIIGRAKSGKSTICYDEIALHEKRNENSLLIVPSKLAFETEKKLAIKLGGFTSTTVCSIETVIDKVLVDIGKKQTFLSTQGMLMIIRKVLETTDLKMFASVCRSEGFAKKCYDIVSDFIANSISPDEIRTALESLDNDDSVLRGKLTDFCEIYMRTEEYLQSKGIDRKDALNAFCDNAENSPIANSHIYIDEPDMLCEQTYTIIETLMKTGRDMTVCLCAELNENAPDYELFRYRRDAYIRIGKMAKELGASVSLYCPNAKNYTHVPTELCHIESNLFAFPYKRYTGQADGSVSLYEYASKDDEIQSVIETIKSITSKDDVRYRDIAVIAADEGAYEVLTRRAFSAAKIPLFCDVKRTLGKMNTATLISRSLACIANGYQADDVIAMMKTGLCDITRSEAEKLENFMLATGISGSALKTAFVSAKASPTIEEARKKIMSPLIALQESFAHETVDKKTEALYSYLCTLNVKSNLEDMATRLSRSGRNELTEQVIQEWNSVVEILSQLHAIMGDIKLSNKRYAAIIEEGLNAEIVSIIPSDADAVLFGSFPHTKPANVKYLFVLGATDDKFPPYRIDSDLIDDSDIAKLESCGISIGHDTTFLSLSDKLDIYTLLTSPSEGLYISYEISASATESAVLPSRIISQLEKILGITTQKRMPQRSCTPMQLAGIMRNYVDGEAADEAALALYAWYEKNSPDTLAMLKRALFYCVSPSNLCTSLVSKLYGDVLRMSATRLEGFNECAFAYFAKYGLHAKERDVREEKASDTGTLYHAVLEAFADYAIANNIDYDTLTEADCDRITDELMLDVFAEHNNGILESSDTNRVLGNYYKRMIKMTIRAIVRHMQAGQFRIAMSEVTFGGENGTFPPITIKLDSGRLLQITGKIDRVDLFVDEQLRKFIRIIDYKKSNTIKKIELRYLLAGVQLQLPLYMSAVSQLMQAEFAGMYYMQIELSNKITGAAAPDEIQKCIQEYFRLNGYTLEDVTVLDITDSAAEAQKDSIVVSSDTLTKDELDIVIAYTTWKAKETASRIESGDISVMPLQTSCNYCPYGPFCTFDTKQNQCKKRRYKPKSAVSCATLRAEMNGAQE